MTLLSIIGIWLLLILLLALEVAVGGTAAMASGAIMAVVVALTYMRLWQTNGVPRAFALAAVFWLTVLLGMGGMDAATRHDVFLKDIKH